MRLRDCPCDNMDYQSVLRLCPYCLVKKSMDLVSNRLYKQRIGPVTEIDEHLAEVDADPQQLEQVLVKLYSISMTDTGFGIEPENVPKIFHPFFTARKKTDWGRVFPYVNV